VTFSFSFPLFLPQLSAVVGGRRETSSKGKGERDGEDYEANALPLPSSPLFVGRRDSRIDAFSRSSAPPSFFSFPFFARRAGVLS